MLQVCVCKQEVITKSGAPDAVVPEQSDLCVHAGFFQKCSAAGVPLQPFQLIFQSLSWTLSSPSARQFLTL